MNLLLIKDVVSSKTEVATITSLDDICNCKNVRTQIQSKVDSVAISKIITVIQVFQTRVSRGSSWIATPEKHANAKCGLLNIKISPKTFLLVYEIPFINQRK